MGCPALTRTYAPVALFKQLFSEMGAEKTSPAGDEDTFCYFIFLFLNKFLIQT
jgi:hypothetical protein